jgi:hypothetical protein
MRSRNSAAYKGLHALLMHDGCLDFRTGYQYDLQTYFDERTGRAKKRMSFVSNFSSRCSSASASRPR